MTEIDKAEDDKAESSVTICHNGMIRFFSGKQGLQPVP